MKCLYTQPNKFNKIPQSQWIGQCYYRTLETSVINSPLSAPSLNQILCHRADTMSQLCIWSLKSANSVENNNKANFIKKNRKQFASRWKETSPLVQGSFLDYTFLPVALARLCGYWQRNFCCQFKLLVKKVLRYWSICSSMVLVMDEVCSKGYRYIKQFRKTFYQGMQESLDNNIHVVQNIVCNARAVTCYYWWYFRSNKYPQG